MNLDEEVVPPTNLSFPVLAPEDIHQVSQTILHLFDPSTSANPQLAKHLEKELQAIQARQEAWGLIAGLSGHENANVRFFAAHTAQVKISRDWETLPDALRPSLLNLLLEYLASALNPANPHTYQSGNGIVLRKLFGCLSSLNLRLPFHHFPHPIITVLQTISASAAISQPLPPSLPSSGYNTPGLNTVSEDGGLIRHKMRLWGLEWCGIIVEEIGRAGLSEQKRVALRKHIEMDLPAVMGTIAASLSLNGPLGSDLTQEEMRLKEVEAGCKCAESWVVYGLGGDELTALLPSLYNVLPLPSASSALVEILSESIFKFGKGTKILTEPLVAWVIGPAGQTLVGTADGEPSDEVLGFTKLLCALIEHSSEWLVARSAQPDIQAFLGVVLRLTGWQGIGSVDEGVSELTLPIYPLIQEALMDSPIFQAPHETSPQWAIAKNFFMQLVTVIRTKVRWPGSGESPDGLGGMDKDDREQFDTWRRDAGEVIVGAFYVLRDDMIKHLAEGVVGQLESNAPWQDIEATLHCIRYSAEAVPLGEEMNLPIIFGERVLGRLAQRPLAGKGEERLRLTTVCLIQGYEEWFKFHPEFLLPVLSYLVPSLTTTRQISRAAAETLKALCDICRNKLVQHINAFSELHGKIGDMGAEEQTKVVEAITSVIQALSPGDAIGPVEGILTPIIDRLSQAVTSAHADIVSAQPALIQTMNALTACFKGLSPSEDDIFETSEEDDEEKTRLIGAAREDPRMILVRTRIEQGINGVVQVWNGDSEVADAISSLLRHATLSSATLISISPLALLTLVCEAAERSPSALWMSLASTLVLRINAPPSPILRKKEKPEDEAVAMERWNVVADAAGRLVGIAGGFLGVQGGMGNHPDVVEAWFKFSSAVASKFPGVLLRLPTDMIEGYMSLGLMGLGAQERFSLKTATEFFVALLATTRYPSPLESVADPLFIHFGPQMLRAILLSAGSEGPRSVIPNLAELLASFVQRISANDLTRWFDAIFSEEGFPDAKATLDSKVKLKNAVLRSRTTKKMREALHEFALVARGLDGTTYGNATGI
ncbi:importin-13, partial [Tremellales sp. Uapishka_1]